MKDNNLIYKLVDFDQIKPFEHNANDHPESQIEELVESIREIGLLNPLLICPAEDGKQGQESYDLVGGHGRLLALERLGVKKIPCLIAEGMSYKDASALAANLADNEIARHSTVNIEELRWSLKELVSNDIDPIYTGYDEEAQKELMLDSEITEGDEFENKEGAGKLPSKKNTITVQGDLFELGEHRLMCGDSSDEQAVETLLDGADIRLLLTDPPYNVDYKRKDGKGREVEGTGIKNDAFEDDEAYCRWLTDVLGVAKNVLDERSAFYIFYSSKKSEFVHRAIRESGLLMRQVIAWVKNAIVMDWSDYHWKHEPCAYGVAEEPDEAVYEDNTVAYGFDNKTTRIWRNDKSQPTVIEANKPRNSKLHPTMKPLVVLGYLIRNSSLPTDNVLDLFGGSGSTMMACEELNRKCYMMELDPRYVDVIIRRYGELTHWDVPIYKLKEEGSRVVKEDVREIYRNAK